MSRAGRVLAGALALVACSNELSGPVPVVTSVAPPEPPVLCTEMTDPPTPVTVNGEGFAPLPVETLTGESELALPRIFVVDSAGTEREASEVTWYSSRRMDFFLPAGVPEGVHGVRVTNANDETSLLQEAFAVIPPPVLDALVPETICTAQFVNRVTIQGAYFLFSDDLAPDVWIDGVAYPGTNPAGCTDLPRPAEVARICTSFDVSIPIDALDPAGSPYDVTVQNPPPAACVSNALPLTVVPPPTVTGVVPTSICASGGTITVTGTGFRDGAVVAVNDVPAETTTFVSDTELTADFPGGLLPVGPGTVTVTNPDGCAATAPATIDILQAPFLFFVDPPVVWNGISVQVTIYGSGVTGPISRVSIQPHADPAGLIDLAFVWDPTYPNRVQAVVPAGLAVGAWDVFVEDQSGCEGFLDSGLTIVSATDVVVSAIDPPFGWTGTSTPVTITADTAAGVGFVVTPRAYLSPVAGGMTAVAVRAVAFLAAETITGVVPPGLVPGAYDVIVVNPDGTVGVLLGGFTVTASPPPVITSVAPASLDAGSPHVIDVAGSGFAGPSVSLRCVDALGTPLAPVDAALSGAPTPTFLQATVPGTIAAGTVCIVRVTNADGTYGEFSAVSFTNPASNLEPFVSSATPGSPVTALSVARRGLAAVSGRATTASRFLFAIGGDDGSVAGAMASVESTTVDAVGRLGAWTAQRHALTAPRTLAGAARVGQFVYLVGGNDGAAALDSIDRARILDPLDVPEVTGIDLALSDGVAGLDGGTWVYRVSGVRDVADASDPGGESLPSDPVTVMVPAVPDKVVVTLSWTAMPGVVGYRIYRTPTAGLAAGAEELIGEVMGATTTFADDGLAAAPPGPLPAGSLGTWHVVSSALFSPRQGLAVAAAEAPGDPTTWYLYAGAGENNAGVALPSYEYVTITIAVDGSQAVSAPVFGDSVIGTARWQLNAHVATAANSPAVPAGTTYVYFTGGRNAAGMAATDTWVGRVNTTPPPLPSSPPLGMLVDPINLFADSTPTARSGGAGAVLANGFLYLFGGGGSPSTGGHSAEICSVAGGACLGPAPHLVNWNSLGAGGILTARYLMGTAIESAFIYVLGGATNVMGTDATTSTERTIW